MRSRSKTKNKYMSTFRLVSLLLLPAALLLAAHLAYGSNVEGRLDYRGSSGAISPAPHLQVNLVDPVQKRSSSTFTGFDGMYYFFNVPPGQYTLEVRTPRNKVLSYKITVRDQPSTPIAPIPIPK
jgi:hypothetical protein